MSKRKKKANEDVEAMVVTEVEETKEETEMAEKKGLINTLKELGNKVPKPVKVVGGILITGAVAAGTALVVMTKTTKDEDDAYIDCDLASDDVDAGTEDTAETESEE